MPKCTADAATCSLLGKFIAVILNPILYLMTAVAVLIFLWGIVQYFWELRKGGKSDDGKRHMAYGLVGLFIIVSTIGILTVISNTVKGLFP